MIGNPRLFGQLVAIVLLATAMRRHGDVGDVLGAGAFWTLLSIGTLLLVLCAPRAQPQKQGAARWNLWLVTLGLLWVLAVPTEPAIAAVTLGFVLVACLAVGRGGSSAAGGRFAGALQFALLTLLVVIATSALVDAVALLRTSFAFVTTAVAGLFQGLGLTVASAGDQLLVHGPKEDHAFRATPNSLGLAIHGAVAATLILHRWLVGARGTALRWWSPLAYLPVAVAVRLVLLVGVGIALEHGTKHDDVHFDFAVFLDWRHGLALDLAAALITGFFFLRSRTAATAPANQEAAAEPRSLRPVLATAAVVLGLMWSSDRIFDCTGAEKPGRVAIDELHSRWESSDVRLTRDHYGQESGYNFRGLANWLEGGLGPIRRLYDPIAAETLRDVDVLIVKTPTQHFSKNELHALHEYVSGGGGLILIGDHTNVYGTSEILNEIAMRYGFRFEYDCCFDHRNRFEFCYRKETWVRNHPIVRGLDTILFEVGCTIDIDSPRVRPIVVGRSIKSQLIDYSAENFYGSPRDTSEQGCGQFALLATCAVGKGRVVAIADSTLFSTFSVFMPGRREIVEGMIAYANRRDVGGSVRDMVQRLAAGLTLVLLLLVMRGAGIPVFVTCALLVWGGSNLSVAVAEAALYPGNPDLRQANASRDVKFLWEDAPLEWPVYGFVERADANFDMFFQFVTRTGAFPRLVRDLGEATSSPGPVVWIDPSPDDPAGVEARLAAFVESGGTLILMETRPNAVVAGMAGRLGLELTDASEPSSVRNLQAGVGRINVPPGVGVFRSIKGGRALLVEGEDPAGSCVGAVQDFGKGRMVLLTCGAMFANTRYGYRYGTIPDPDMRRLYEVQYAIMAAAIRP